MNTRETRVPAASRRTRGIARAWSILRRRAKANRFEDRECLCEKPRPHLTMWMSGPNPRWILVTTKSTWMEWASPLPADLLVVQKYGLPAPVHVEWLREISARIRATPVFAGDLDPLDLTAFAAWRSGDPAFSEPNCQRLELIYGGVNDGWAHDPAGCRTWPDGFRIAMKPFEREHWAFVKRLLPDVHGLVGDECCRLLDSGLKIELEGATNPAIHGRRHPASVIRVLRRVARGRS